MLVFAVTCVHCRETLLTTPRIGDGEVQRLEQHLRACRPDALPAKDPALRHILAEFRVTPADD